MTLLAFCFALALPVPAQSPAQVIGDFGAGWEQRWRVQQLGGREGTFRVEQEAGEPVLRAEADSSATALFRPLDGGGDRERITWRWRVAAPLTGDADETSRAGDDYAARLFVIFGDGEMSRDTRALCYVWAARQGIGSTYRSPVVDGVQTIVLQSGAARAGEWVLEERDFVADYRAAFGRDPEPVAGIALMVDTDDTDSRATAWYDDIVIR